MSCVFGINGNRTESLRLLGLEMMIESFCCYDSFAVFLSLFLREKKEEEESALDPFESGVILMGLGPPCNVLLLYIFLFHASFWPDLFCVI